MSTFSKQIDSNIRDVDHTDSGGWSIDQDSAWNIGNPGAVTRNIGLRFTGVTVPQGATINSSRVSFNADGTKTSSVVLGIKGVDEDNTAEFVLSPESSARTRTQTTAGVAWGGSVSQTEGVALDSPDISSIVQEIVDRGGWSSGNAMAFFFYENGSTSGHYLSVDEYNDSSSVSATLYIDYDASSESSSESSSASSSISSSNSPSSSESSSESSSVSESSSASSSESSSISPSPSGDSDYGIKIAKEGYKYTNADNRLVFNSQYPLLKIKSSGSGTLTLSSGAGSKTVVTHNLGYLPMFYVWINYCDISSGTEVEQLRMCSWSEYAGLGVSSSYDAYATTTTIELNVNTAKGGSETLDYRYVVFYDPLS